MTTLPQTTTARTPQAISPSAAMAHAPTVAAGGGGAQITAGDVWRIIRTNLWLILLLLVLSGAAGYGINMLLLKKMPRFTATGWLQIQTKMIQDPVTDQEVDLPEANVLTEQRSQAQLLRTEGLFSTLLKESREVQKTGWYRSFVSRGADAGGEQFNARAAKDYLEKYFDVRPVTDSNLLAVTFTWSNPADAKTVLEEMVRLHVDAQRARAFDRKGRQIEMLNSLKNDLSAQYDTLVKRIRQRRTELSTKGMGLPGEFRSKEVELSRLLENQMKAASQAAEAALSYERVNAQIQRGETPSEIEKAVENDPTTAGLIRELVSMEINRDSKAETLDKLHREVQALNRVIDLTKQKVENRRAELRTKYRQQYLDTLMGMRMQSAAELAEVTKRIDDMKKELSDLNKEVTFLLIDQEEEKSLREERQRIDTKLRDIGNLQAYNTKQSPVDWATSGKPEIPEMPSFPKLKYTLSLAMLLGLALGIGIAFLRELLDETVRSPRDISRVGHLNLLGMVADDADDPQAAGARLAIFDAPHSLTAEQFRQIRTRLQHAAPLDTTRSLLVTGTSAMDGKTTVAANLAAGLALNGRRTLLVDANFRRPELHRLFGIANDRGFAEALAGNTSLDELTHATRIPNLAVLASGPRPANPTELFESQLFTDFLDQAMQQYDHVVFDSAPFLVVSESTALAPRVDGVITVVRAHEESRGLLQRMRDSLRQIKAKHVGVVLNAVRGRAGGYYRRNIRAYYDYQS